MFMKVDAVASSVDILDLFRGGYEAKICGNHASNNKMQCVNNL